MPSPLKSPIAIDDGCPPVAGDWKFCMLRIDLLGSKAALPKSAFPFVVSRKEIGPLGEGQPFPVTVAVKA
jgi:hypothetical protein